MSVKKKYFKDVIILIIEFWNEFIIDIDVGIVIDIVRIFC